MVSTKSAKRVARDHCAYVSYLPQNIPGMDLTSVYPIALDRWGADFYDNAAKY